MRGRSKERTKHLDLRLTPQEWDMVHDVAADYGLDVSSLVRHLLQRASLERLGVPPRPAVVAEQLVPRGPRDRLEESKG